MVTGYEILLWLHILAAVIWVGGGFAIQLFAIRATRSSDPHAVARLGRDAEWIGTRVFIPASVAVLAFGFGLVAQGNWSLGSFWVAFGLGAVAFSAVIGSAFLGPESGRIGKLAAERGPADPEVTRRIRRIFVVSRIELVILLAAIFAMVIKPTF